MGSNAQPLLGLAYNQLNGTLPNEWGSRALTGKLLLVVNDAVADDTLLNSNQLYGTLPPQWERLALDELQLRQQSVGQFPVHGRRVF